ncbi:MULTISPECIES: S1 RNA-binding domain-containing protein [Actinosynnema]|uniref:S1 RNA-binding domain-containing protein n=1 Tax=Actinosynnema TaxID=40566 RepID=UPI0020A26F8D|nr:S1 RNA-binding domain-containing protein [Actinosynnema pretiosum]MCP2094426.1 S1 RNA binding domain-containing protein [Actinosynnema pretiosum]
MSALFKPARTLNSEPGNVFFAMPFNKKRLQDGTEFDFDDFYRTVCVPVVRDACGMTPVRVDGVYGSEGVLDAIWRAMQLADLVVADCTGGSPNVAFEIAWALMLNKRIVLITQNPDDIPTDIRGLYRYLTYSQNYQAIDQLKGELKLQLEALAKEPSDEMAPMPMPGGSTTLVKARVINADEEYVMVRDDSGRYGVMGNADVDYLRLIKDMRKLYPVGTVLDGAFVLDPMRKEMRYTLLSGQVNPWPLLGRQFTPGTPLVSRVANSDLRHGAFVHVGHGVNGLVPSAQFDGKVPPVGTEVEVAVVSVDEQRRRIALRLARVMPGQPEARRARSDGREKGGRGEDKAQRPRLAELHWRGYAEVSRIAPERDGKGGYLLMRLPTTGRDAMMLVRDMSEELRTDLNSGEVEVGEEILVEVVRVNTMTGKTLLRELPEPEEVPAAA